MEIVITDLTRFSNPDIVCIAGINKETGECIRPLPYIQLADCKRLNILPGNIIDGSFIKSANIENPHSEDCDYSGQLTRVRICESDEFQSVLESNLSVSISDGFNYPFPERGKVILSQFKPTKSIITLKVSTRNLEIVKDNFKEGKIRLHLLDNDGVRFSFLSITDLGFYNYAMKHYHDVDFPNIINNFIRQQDIVYLRIGLGREYQGGFWLQVNGIYTFPNYDTEIRSYS
ncbi:hypothetical protein KKC13_05240 [bacterium]|nr:hypothetical protein [bacterium]MBU1959376.1 hypothetical protein [bacterium]